MENKDRGKKLPRFDLKKGGEESGVGKLKRKVKAAYGDGEDVDEDLRIVAWNVDKRVVEGLARWDYVARGPPLDYVPHVLFGV